MNACAKNIIATQIANNAYDGLGLSIEQTAASLNFSVETVHAAVSELVSSGKIELRTVLAGNPFTGSQRSEIRYLPIIDGKGRSYADRHMFSRKGYISAVTQ